MRVIAAETGDVVEEARLRHGLSPTATAALGRALTGALLLAQLLLKTPKERIALRFEGDGPLGGMIAEAGPDGTVRGYARNPHVDLPVRGDGKLDVGGLVGRGNLQVDRSLPSGEVYSSRLELRSGEVAEDLAYYLFQSEQTPAAVLLGVRLGSDGAVDRAGGMVIQVLPGAKGETIDRLERNLAGVSFSALLKEKGLEGAVKSLLEGVGFERTDLEVPARFQCRCNRERALEALVFFTPGEREEMIVQDGGAEVVCHWCGARYRFSPEEIRSLVAEVRCPDCGALWLHPKGDGTLARIEGETCRCGRKVELGEVE